VCLLGYIYIQPSIDSSAQYVLIHFTVMCRHQYISLKCFRMHTILKVNVYVSFNFLDKFYIQWNGKIFEYALHCILINAYRQGNQTLYQDKDLLSPQKIHSYHSSTEFRIFPLHIIFAYCRIYTNSILCYELFVRFFHSIQCLLWFIHVITCISSSFIFIFIYWMNISYGIFTDG
jgi:hypothetical protein